MTSEFLIFSLLSAKSCQSELVKLRKMPILLLQIIPDILQDKSQRQLFEKIT